MRPFHPFCLGLLMSALAARADGAIGIALFYAAKALEKRVLF